METKSAVYFFSTKTDYKHGWIIMKHNIITVGSDWSGDQYDVIICLRLLSS